MLSWTRKNEVSLSDYHVTRVSTFPSWTLLIVKLRTLHPWKLFINVESIVFSHSFLIPPSFRRPLPPFYDVFVLLVDCFRWRGTRILRERRWMNWTPTQKSNDTYGTVVKVSRCFDVGLWQLFDSTDSVCFDPFLKWGNPHGRNILVIQFSRGSRSVWLPLSFDNRSLKTRT